MWVKLSRSRWEIYRRVANFFFSFYEKSDKIQICSAIENRFASNKHERRYIMSETFLVRYLKLALMLHNCALMPMWWITRKRMCDWRGWLFEISFALASYFASLVSLIHWLLRGNCEKRKHCSLLIKKPILMFIYFHLLSFQTLTAQSHTHNIIAPATLLYKNLQVPSQVSKDAFVVVNAKQTARNCYKKGKRAPFFYWISVTRIDSSTWKEAELFRSEGKRLASSWRAVNDKVRNEFTIQ